MTGGGRRFAARTSVAFFAAVLGFWTAAASAEAATNQFDLSIKLGYNNTLKLGQWMPVVVDVTNHGPAMDGMLEVQALNNTLGNGAPPVGVAIYQTPISLATGASKHIRTYTNDDFQGPIAVRVVQNGQVLASAQSPATNTYNGLMAAVISDQPAALDNLGIVRTGLSPIVVHLKPAEIPDTAPVLRAFDLIAIDDFATDTLTEGQRGALTDYVMQGGSLLLGTGGSWHKTLAGLPEALVPMRVNGSTILGFSSTLAAGSVEVATGPLSTGRSWLADGGQPLIVEASVGAGVVEMATFDWNQDSISTSAPTTALLRQALVRSTSGNSHFLTNNGPYITKFGGSSSLAVKGGSLSRSLGNTPSLNLPAWWVIGALVLTYVLLAGPVNYFVLRMINRRALAWITVPAIAAVGSAGAYGATVITKGTSVQANQVAIVHLERDWDRAYQEQYTGIVAPTRGDYEVGLGAGRKMVSPIFYNYSGPTSLDPNFGAFRVNTTTQVVTLPGMTAFTLRAFANEGIVAAPKLTAQTNFANGRFSGSVHNLSSIRFTDGAVLAGSSAWKIGALVPNGNVDFDFQVSSTSPVFTGQPSYITLYPSAFTGAPMSSASDLGRENETRSAILSTLFASYPTGLGGPVKPTVVLWTRQAFDQVTVNGSRPRTYADSAVVLTLPVGPITGALPPSVIPGRIVDIQADITQGGGPPGMILAQSGSIVYSFTPPIAPGHHLVRAAIDSFNPYGQKGVAVGPNGTVPAAKAQVWDWSKSAWVDLKFQENGSNPVPDGAINPTTGEVRLQLSSENQFSSTPLSLGGTVS